MFSGRDLVVDFDILYCPGFRVSAFKILAAILSSELLRQIARLFLVMSLAFSQLAAAGRVVRISQPAVGKNKKLVIAVDFSTEVRGIPDAHECYLQDGGSERVFCEALDAIDHRVRFVFRITPANFALFERLVTDSDGYALWNNEPIVLLRDTLQPGALGSATTGRIPTIDAHAWADYILGDYGSHYLFPQLFEAGTTISIHDSTSSIYHLEVAQSDRLFSSATWSFFWGIQGRWSSSKSDRMNFVRLVPLTLLRSDPLLPVAFSAGVETGPSGFGAAGRGFISGTTQFRLPFNPFDLTFGAPRWRLNPIVNVTLQAHRAWSNKALPDSLGRGFEISSTVRYDVPVGRRYYLQTSTTFLYPSGLGNVRYRLMCSMGYIVDGTMRLLLSYREGYQPVTYLYDSQLLVGVAFDALNAD